MGTDFRQWAFNFTSGSLGSHFGHSISRMGNQVHYIGIQIKNVQWTCDVTSWYMYDIENMMEIKIQNGKQKL